MVSLQCCRPQQTQEGCSASEKARRKRTPPGTRQRHGQTTRERNLSTKRHTSADVCRVTCCALCILLFIGACATCFRAVGVEVHLSVGFFHAQWETAIHVSKGGLTSLSNLEGQPQCAEPDPRPARSRTASTYHPCNVPGLDCSVQPRVPHNGAREGSRGPRTKTTSGWHQLSLRTEPRTVKYNVVKCPMRQRVYLKTRHPSVWESFCASSAKRQRT